MVFFSFLPSGPNIGWLEPAEDGSAPPWLLLLLLVMSMFMVKSPILTGSDTVEWLYWKPGSAANGMGSAPKGRPGKLFSGLLAWIALGVAA